MRENLRCSHNSSGTGELRKAGSAAWALTMLWAAEFGGEGAAVCKPVMPENSARLAFGNYWSSDLLRALPASFCVCVISSIRQQHCAKNAKTSTRVFSVELGKFKELNSTWEWKGWVGWEAQQLSCFSSSQISFWEWWESAAFFPQGWKIQPWSLSW